ncbi:PREDICTED: voltage-dependent calcium channel gamma-like subunit [Nanorana parkeri]|uniref:voltage-dependent calcium channel gamma-like subunit n=1 Tax=Nanorana parkeri TaxID=125878 RepID=UPI0008542FAE|nr:PREDICTED: voltage-dependent calcium channel gamma-like subunit [Nanorana parkeri]
MAPRVSAPKFFETFLRVLMTLSAGTAIVLSSVSICDGNWLSGPGGPLIGVWDACRAEADPPCSGEAARLSRMMVVVRSAACLAVVLAIFGLELMMMSQLCDDGHSRRKWALGCAMLLAAFLLSSAGTATYVLLLRDLAVCGTFTLTFWAQFLAVFLFFLNAISGLHLNRLTA